MKPFPSFLLCVFLFCAYACSGAGTGNRNGANIILVGSTPGDEVIKSMLAIRPEMKIDFIRWHLQLDHSEKENRFSLHIAYGMSQPNTMGFTKDREEKTISGKFITTINEKDMGTLYHLSSTALPATITLLQLNENIFHFMAPDQQLIAGNGGWSYTLHREVPVPQTKILSAFILPAALFADTATQLTFDGRTPCKGFLQDYDYQLPSSCFKLKWRVVLYRDPQTKQPTTYAINRTASRDQLLTGKWVIRPHPLNSKALMIQLDPEHPENTLSFLVGDRNVLFFLDRNYQPYIGNKDFSYTLNLIK